MENVDRIRKSAILSDVVEQYQKEGYGLTAVIIDASYCNTPQARKRFFLIGELGGVNNALLAKLKQNLNSKPMTIRDYLGDKLGVDYYYRHPRNYNRRGIFSIDEPSPTVRGVNRPVPSGYKKHSGDPKEIELSEVRPLTTIERSYLQTFPEDFKFFGTKTNLEQMIGNAVPVNLAEFLGSIILEYEEDKSSKKNFFSNDIDFFIPQTTLHRMCL
jgi:DNA (cytosine-5)-methyltransferase 1